MAMTVKTQVIGEKAKLSLSGRFDFTMHREFLPKVARIRRSRESEYDAAPTVP
jgi:hypothetical protein